MIRSATANPRSAWIKVSSNSCSVALSSFFLVKIEVIEPPMDDDDFDRPWCSRENQPLRWGTSATGAGALTGDGAGTGTGATLTTGAGGSTPTPSYPRRSGSRFAAGGLNVLFFSSGFFTSTFAAGFLTSTFAAGFFASAFFGSGFLASIFLGSDFLVSGFFFSGFLASTFLGGSVFTTLLIGSGVTSGSGAGKAAGTATSTTASSLGLPVIRLNSFLKNPAIKAPRANEKPRPTELWH